MTYTVNQLAKLSGVTVRTLHYYDEIGLLKPSFLGENNYRYYQDEELLLLQQILFYRQLNFSLSDIQRILSDAGFDKIKALESHKLILEKNINQTKSLIDTVNKTIAHLKGKHIMKLENIFEGFDTEKQKMYETFLIKSGVPESEIENVRDKVNTWTQEDWMKNKNEADSIYAALGVAIENHLSVSSPEVQKLIKQHYEMTKAFWTPNKKSYVGLSQLYASHPDFVAFYHKINPNLLTYLMEAMKVYADKNLK